MPPTTTKKVGGLVIKTDLIYLVRVERGVHDEVRVIDGVVIGPGATSGRSGKENEGRKCTSELLYYNGFRGISLGSRSTNIHAHTYIYTYKYNVHACIC